MDIFASSIGGLCVDVFYLAVNNQLFIQRRHSCNDSVIGSSQLTHSCLAQSRVGRSKQAKLFLEVDQDKMNPLFRLEIVLLKLKEGFYIHNITNVSFLFYLEE